MEKHLFCITLLTASLLTACGSKNQEVQSYNIENIVLPSDGNDLTEADKQRQYLATAVGNTSSDKITIMDIDGNLLFPEE